MRYDNLISKNAMKNQLEKDEIVIQVNQNREKLMKMVSGNTKYEMEWWRTHENDHRQMYGALEEIDYKQPTQSMPVTRTQEEEYSRGGEGNEDGEEGEAEEKYGLFRNDTAKSVWAYYSLVSVMDVT